MKLRASHRLGKVGDPRATNLTYNMASMIRKLATHPGRGCKTIATGSALALITLLILLAGCSDTRFEDPLADYNKRLQRSLDIEPLPLVLDPIEPLPRPSALKLDFEKSTIGTLDFMALSGCAVQVNIGRRNSSLGRMASASQRLLLELEFLELAPDCIPVLEERGEDALVAALESALLIKTEQLPGRIFNATLGGPEYRKLWRSNRELAEYPANTSSTVVSALEAIDALTERWLTGDYRADNQQFEIYLSEVAIGDAGSLLRALNTQHGWLRQANGVLAARAEHGPLCPPGFQFPDAEILQNVVHKFFIGKVQPQAAALSRRYHTLMPPLTALEQRLHAASPVQYQRWVGQRDQQFATLLAAPADHVHQLKGLLDPCQ